MNREKFKRKMLDACIEKHQSVIDDFNERLGSLMESERIFNDEELDGGRLAQKAQMDSEVYTLNNQLDFVNTEMELLKDLKNKPSLLADHPCPGAAIVTNQGTFFVSASIEDFTVDGKTYKGLSTSSPLYIAMKGKKAGDYFWFRDNSYSIKEIY